MRRLLAILFVFINMAHVMTVPCYAADNSINWTEDEIAFIEAHPVIRLGVDPGFVPFEFIDRDGEYKGITADYLSLISEKTGLRFEVQKGLTWPEAYDKTLAGGMDVLPAISKTEEREQHFLFSEPYYYFKRVIVTRADDTAISGMEDLAGQTAAVQRNSSHHSYLLSYPNINLSLYDSVEAALTAVATGSEAIFIGNLATTNYLIRSNGLTNLRFVAFEAEKQQALYFAVRKDWPELVSIFDKAMDTITENEKLAINNKWIELETDIDYGPIIRILSIAGAFVAAILAVSFFWIIRLRKEVRMRELIQADLEKAKQEADEANEFKSSFMARMSHEIRTPLNAITGMAYLLKKTEITLTQNMYIDKITQASNNMLGIINDILDFSKIEAGKVELEITSFSMDQVIQDVVNIVSYKIEEQGIGFKLSKDPQVPDWFFGDPKRIEQILLNILNNAAKFTSAGEVSLDLRLTAKEKDRYHLSFTIKDTGIGMTEEQVKKLFTPFTQADISINRRFGGSGLGLSIVKNLLDMMGGQIQVFSTPGEGSTFIIHLSLRIDKEKEDEDIKTLSASDFKDIRALNPENKGVSASQPVVNKEDHPVMIAKPHCVLVAEDNKTNQLIARSLLQQAGVEWVLANDGREAVELYKQHGNNIDLILMDLHMPEMNGYEAAEEIRKISDNVPIVAMTADVISGVKEKCGQSGIYHYISKPFDPDHFIQTIKDIIAETAEKEVQELSILDRSAGIKNMGGDRELYRQVLNEYYKENQDTLERLSLTISEKRYADAGQIVHKMKGSSGSIGANALYDLAVRLQKALHDEDEREILLLYEEFPNALSKLLGEIREYRG